MGKKHVYMIHSYVHDVDSLVSSLRILDASLCEELVWDPEDPEYVFVSEQIIVFENSYRDYLRLLKKCGDKSVWIGVFNECLIPDLNMFDYAICFDKKIRGERIGGMPLFLLFGESVFSVSNNLSVEDAHSLFREKSFCEFMYSNGGAHPMRDELFNALSGYKRVDSFDRYSHYDKVWGK